MNTRVMKLIDLEFFEMCVSCVKWYGNPLRFGHSCSNSLKTVSEQELQGRDPILVIMFGHTINMLKYS